ncbi:DUF2232 domain-containing protein [Kaarinaea lacus]
MKSLASFILRGPGQAILITAGTGVLAMVIPPLSLVSGAAVALTTMRAGPKSGLVVMLGSTAFVALLAWMSTDTVLPGLMLLGVLWLPLWLMGWILRETRSLALTMLITGALGILGIVAVYAILGDTASWWNETLLALSEPALQAGSPLKMEDVEVAMATMSRVMNGIVAAGIVMSSLLALFLARWMQAQLFNPGGFRSEFHELRLGKGAAIFALLVISLSMLPMDGLSSVATEVMIVALSLYVIQGFAVAHGVVAIKKLHVGWLIGLYMVAIFVMRQLVALMALLGLIDTWVDFRRRIRAQQGAG